MCKDNIHIAFTIASIAQKYGGTSRVVSNLSDALIKTGIKVSIITACDSEDKKILPTSNNVNLTYIYKNLKLLNFLKHYSFEKTLTRSMATYNKNIVHDNGVWLPFNHLVANTCRKYSFKRIVSPHGMLEPWAMNYKRYKKGIGWFIFQKNDLQLASAFHATSQEEAENIRKIGFKQAIAVIPNGVLVPDKIVNEKKAQEKYQRKALFLSRIHPKKGLHNLLDAWETLKPNEWRLLIVGPEEAGYRAEIEGKIKAKGLESFIELRGEVNDLEKWDLYKSSALFVLPSFSENFGIVVAEALAAGVPVITTRGTPWSDLQKYDCGWWVDIGVEPLVKALREAINMEPARLCEMGDRGAKLIESKYLWPQIGKQMLEFYEWLLGIGPKPSCLFD